MKKLLTIAIFLSFALGSMAQTYSTMWKKVKEARDKDLPRTEIKALEQIVERAQGERAYGQLLKAQLMTADLESSLSPDSAEVEIAKIKTLYSKAKDKALKAIYATVLYKIYEHGDTAQCYIYRKAALADMDVLAKADADGYSPMIVDGKDSEIFGDDLLSVIGFTTRQYVPLYYYYKKKGNRRAACICGLYAIKDRQDEGKANSVKKSPSLAAMDTLTNLYGDLDVAGEVAVERYNFMGRFSDVTVEDKISYINNALSKWGTWQRASELRNAQKQLTAPTLSLSIDKDITQPDKSKKVKINRIRNVSELKFNVYSTSLNGNCKYVPNHNSGYKYIKPYLSATPVQTVNRRYANHPDYAFFEDSLEINALLAGVYMIEVTTVPQTQTIRRLYYVSGMGVVYIDLPNDKRRIVAVNATTGQPVAGAKVEINYSDAEKTPSTILTTDDKGETIISVKNKYINAMRAYTAEDMASPMRNAGGWFSYSKDNKEREITNIFTDRAIYRPGQTVHASAIVFKKKSTTDNEVVKGKQVEAILRDANNKDIGKKTLTTDDFGSCTADFVLPQNTLNGSFTMCINNNNQTFKVESYKRPTFTIEFPKINEKYALGDTLIVKAKALTYAGVAVQGAKVKYEVTRRNAFWLWRMNRSYSTPVRQVYQGEATTDDNGNFDITMPLVSEILPSWEGRTGFPLFYNFTTTATVTDLAGETHSAELDVPIGSKPTFFSVDIPDKVLADNLRKVKFNLYNTTGADIHANVKYSVDGGAMQQAKTTEPLSLGSLPSGKHELYAICEVDTLRKEFVVFNLDDEKPAVETNDWFYVSDEKFPSDGKPVTIQVGSSAKDMHILYTLIAEDRLLESGSVEKSEELLNRKLAYKEEYGDVVRLDYAWVKDGEFHIHSTELTRPEKPTMLKMEWTTFRDRLTPGQKEEWTLRITRPDGTPAKAQALLTMYDKALDQIVPHSLEIYKPNGILVPNTSWNHPHFTGIYGNGYRSPSRMSYRQLSLSHFDDDVYPFYGYGELLSARGYIASRRTRGGIMRAKEMMSVEESADAMVFATYDTYGNDVTIKLDADVHSETTELSENKVVGYSDNKIGESVQMRENLAETVFFMPQLVADSTGTVKIKFTLPESLTTWRLLGVSHTQDMMTGKIEGEAVAQKSLMVVPNVPRFVRSGDKVTIIARIYNNVEKTLSGNATMTLIDPETDKVVMTITSQYEADALATTTAAFSFEAPADYQMLVCKISASADGFSDGEQHYLPILSDKELVTETRSLSPHGLSPSLPHGEGAYRITLEYTANPSWLAYQALPQIASTNDDNAISLAAAIYANALGRKIVSEAPVSLKSQFEQWKNNGSLKSNLLKNEELKDMLINETPWVADATNETETKQRLGEFFDQTTIDYRIDNAVRKLQTLQTSDNMWSWWKGMGGSPYMTMEVVTMMVRLETMGIAVDELKDNVDGARRALDSYIINKVKKMKSEEAKGHKQSFPYGIALDYLYVNAIAPRELSAEAESASDYLIAKLRKETKKQSIGDKATSAIILNANGFKSMAREYAQSLKEYTVYSNELGRYYDTRKAEYSWRDYRIPTQVAAIEALSLIAPNDTATIDQMTQWLLAQKRTQAWDTPINTVNAVYVIAKKAPSAKFVYVKKSYDNPKGKNIAFDIPADGNYWGAIYIQSWQKSTDMKSSSTGLSIKREILDDKGKNVKSLKVGDRVKVRLTIKADRDFDFVSVVDRRAASMEPVVQTSGYAYDKYVSPKDNATYYYFDQLRKGTHTIETEYTIDREGTYTMGTATVQCAYAPEFRATAVGTTIKCQ